MHNREYANTMKKRCNTRSETLNIQLSNVPSSTARRTVSYLVDIL